MPAALCPPKLVALMGDKPTEPLGHRTGTLCRALREARLREPGINQQGLRGRNRKGEEGSLVPHPTRPYSEAAPIPHPPILAFLSMHLTKLKPCS